MKFCKLTDDIIPLGKLNFHPWLIEKLNIQEQQTTKM